VHRLIAQRAVPMILDQFPDLAPRPLTPRNAGFRAWFAQRWGRENLAVLGCASKSAYAPYRSLLSIKFCWDGIEHYELDGRRLAVGAQRYLVVNDGASAGVEIDSPLPVTSLAVFFRPGMADELRADLLRGDASGLDCENELGRASGEFAPHLRPMTPALAQSLARLRDAIRGGLDDEAWLEERLQLLLALLLAADRGWQRRRELLSARSKSAHAELLARVDRATDFILSCHRHALTLDDVAAHARLSKYHLVRVFREVHGVTPMDFLARQRSRVAAQLITRTGLALDEVASLSGFGSRQTMYRQLRRHRGAGAQALRDRLREATGAIDVSVPAEE
jgi:AraC-like DNA-binding protein